MEKTKKTTATAEILREFFHIKAEIKKLQATEKSLRGEVEEYVLDAGAEGVEVSYSNTHNLRARVTEVNRPGWDSDAVTAALTAAGLNPADFQKVTTYNQVGIRKVKK